MIGTLAPAPLEDWFRDRYFTARVDIAGSGVEDYSLGDLRRILGLSLEALDGLVFRDSPSVGAAGLREAIAARYSPGRAADVMVTHGSSEAIFLALAAIVRPGDEVVVVEPGYHALIATVASLGGVPRVWRLSEEKGFEPDLDRLRTLMGQATRAVVVNFPHNPTGVTIGPHVLHDLLATVAKSRAYLLWDGAFTDLVYDTPPLPDPGQTLERCVSFGTLSKAYGLPGLRIGWAIAPPQVIGDMVRVRDYLTLATSPLTEMIATAAVSGADALIGPRMAQARANREVLRGWAEEHDDLVECPQPAGGVTAFPRIRHEIDTTRLCRELAGRLGVLVVPGSCFGRPDRVRIGFGGSGGNLAIGLAALASLLTGERG